MSYRGITPRYPSSKVEEKINIGLSSGPDKEIINVPNAISIAGYASTVAWLLGASPVFAVAGIAADELDGSIARATNTTTEFGSLLDWGIDLTLTGAVAWKAGLIWALPFITATQVYLRHNQIAPQYGSARALMTGYALLK